jgi:hypothetical protein
MLQAADVRSCVHVGSLGLRRLLSPWLPPCNCKPFLFAVRGRQPAFRTPRVSCGVPAEYAPDLWTDGHMTQHMPRKLTKSSRRRQWLSTACSVRLDFLCPFFNSSEGFTGAHQSAVQSAPVVALTWVLWSSRSFRSS